MKNLHGKIHHSSRNYLVLVTQRERTEPSDSADASISNWLSTNQALELTLRHPSRHPLLNRTQTSSAEIVLREAP